MARESQTLQIFLIVFVMLTVIAGAAAFLGWKNYGEAKIEAADAQKKAQEAQQQASAAQADAAKLKQMIGAATTDAVNAVQDEFNKEIQLYGATLPADKKAYREVVKSLADTLQDREAKLGKEGIRNQDLENRLTTREQEALARIQKEKDRADKAEADRTAQKDTFDDDRKKMKDLSNGLAGQLDKVKEESGAATAKLQASVDQYVAYLKRSREDVKLLRREKEEMTRPTFEVADGKIVWVNQRDGMVYINLGQSDALNQLTTFTVYDANTNDVTKATKKASIEVTKILGPDMAEARILEDKFGDPILQGDVIYTPLWKPGQQKHFVLAGVMDVDGDGKSDLELVRKLIQLNGGAIDSYWDGKMRASLTGRPEEPSMTSRTDYLILGTPPGPESPPALINDFTAMKTEAERLVIKQLSLRDMLAQMGYKSQSQIQRFGPGVTSREVRLPKSEDLQRASRGNVSPLFQPRQPPRSGAYGGY